MNDSGLREWSVGGAIVLDAEGSLLLVKNRRRNGSHDWTPPGGVIELADGEPLLVGLAREVLEETGLTVGAWAGPLWHVEAIAPSMGFHMTVEVWLAIDVTGVLRVGDDPDGIVVDAEWVDPAGCDPYLATSHPWVREPLAEWMVERWEHARRFRYEVEGTGLADARARRVDP